MSIYIVIVDAVKARLTDTAFLSKTIFRF